MKLIDDRTDEQKRTHPCLIIGTDRVLSGWGGATGGLSYAAWACREEDRGRVLDWVERRGDMTRVRETYGEYRPKRCAHCHIYVVGENHPAIKKYYQSVPTRRCVAGGQDAQHKESKR